MKAVQKYRAIQLRRKGMSYSDILKEVAVAKSTLSLWLRSVVLSKRQKQRLTTKKLAAMKRGWESIKKRRVEKTKSIKENAKLDVQNLVEKDLWLAGVCLYWAEGSKEKDYGRSQGVIFSNSDPLMIKIFLKWLEQSLKIPHQNIIMEIYVHEHQRNQLAKIRTFWSDVTGFPVRKFDRIYFKRNKIPSQRRNTAEKYHGLVRVRIVKSTDLNRKIAGWIEGLCKYWGVV